MKKNIIISTQLIEIGGVEKSLLGLLDSIDYERYNVDVFIFNHDGALKSLINKNARLLPELPQYAALFRPMRALVTSGNWRTAAVKIMATIKSKWKSLFYPPEKGKTSNLYHTYLIDYASRFLPAVSDKTYDVCMSFLHPNFVERRRIKAASYWAWIHTDYSNLVIDPVAENKMWAPFKHIIAVSEECRNAFISVLPRFEQRVRVIENIISYPYIMQELRDRQDPALDAYSAFSGYRILTIGRFSYAKNLEVIPEVVREMLRSGCKDFKWYIIGFGGDEHLVKDLIEQYGLQDHIILLGKKKNPYSYLEQCDVYVQPSRFEGKSVSVREAQLLKRPVIIADYPTAPSQVRHGYDGLIVPLDTAAIAAAVMNLLGDSRLRQQLSDNCDPHRYTNAGEIEKIYRLIHES